MLMFRRVSATHVQALDVKSEALHCLISFVTKDILMSGLLALCRIHSAPTPWSLVCLALFGDRTALGYPSSSNLPTVTHSRQGHQHTQALLPYQDQGTEGYFKSNDYILSYSLVF